MVITNIFNYVQITNVGARHFTRNGMEIGVINKMNGPNVKNVKNILVSGVKFTLPLKYKIL